MFTTLASLRRRGALLTMQSTIKRLLRSSKLKPVRHRIQVHKYFNVCLLIMIDPVTIYSIVSVGLLVTSEILSLVPDIRANGIVHALLLLTKQIQSLPRQEVLDDLDSILGVRETA